MLRLVQKICLSFTVLTVCLYLSPGRAQEVEASDELEQQSADTSNRLLYIDLPVALEEGVDLAMPKPIYPEQSNAEDDLEPFFRELVGEVSPELRDHLLHHRSRLPLHIK